MSDEGRELAEEIGWALAPVLVDVLTGRREEQVFKDAMEAVLRLFQNHLFESNAAVLLADFRAIMHFPGKVLEWLIEHPYASPEPSSAIDSIEAAKMIGAE
jgi:hypothetical protein